MNIERLDQTDINILRAIQENARLTTKELAQKVHLSTTPVFERLRRLEREGYIKKYMALLDANKAQSRLHRVLQHQIAQSHHQYVSGFFQICDGGSRK